MDTQLKKSKICGTQQKQFRGTFIVIQAELKKQGASQTDNITYNAPLSLAFLGCMRGAASPCLTQAV